MNLVTELNRIAARNAQAEIDEANKILDSVKSHLTDEAEADKDMLQYFGTAEAVEKHSSLKQSATKRLNGQTLTKEDVKDICIKYGLRCLKANQYVKEIPAKSLNDLRNYKENFDGIFDPSCLFVIAPVSHFKLGPKPEKDPVLIYWTSKGGVVVSQWGSDFSFMRRVYGFIMAKFTYAIYSLLFLAGFSAVVFGMSQTKGNEDAGTQLLLVFSGVGLLGLLIYCCAEELLETHHSRWNKSTL